MTCHLNRRHYCVCWMWKVVLDGQYNPVGRIGLTTHVVGGRKCKTCWQTLPSSAYICAVSPAETWLTYSLWYLRHRCPRQRQVNIMPILWQYSRPASKWVILVDLKSKYEPHYGVHHHNTGQSDPDIIIEGSIRRLPSSNWAIRYRLCLSSVCQYRLVRYLIREFWPV